MFLFKKKKEITKNGIYSVASGKIIPLENVNDPVFSEKMIGDGFAVELKSDYLVAPFDGEVCMIYPTLHAFGINNKDDIEVLVHIGINTNALNGKGFEYFVNVGDKVKQGDLIAKVDTHYIKSKGFDASLMQIYPNRIKEKIIMEDNIKKVVKGNTLVAIYRNDE